VNHKYKRGISYELQDTFGNSMRDVPPDHLKLVGEIEDVINCETDDKGITFYECKFSDESFWLEREYIPEYLLLKFEIDKQQIYPDYMKISIKKNNELILKKTEIVNKNITEDNSQTIEENIQANDNTIVSKKRKRGRPCKTLPSPNNNSNKISNPNNNNINNNNNISNPNKRRKL
jgi:hypothetical protein